jgi:dTDP-4-dehydrorhamnose reductase
MKNTMKVLILGANGLIGQHAVRLCKKKAIDYIGTCYSRPKEGFIAFNQLDLENIPTLFDKVSPTVVFNAIGLAGGVNFCETHPETGRQYHVDATKVMAEWCNQQGAVFAYISTDYVFDGQNPPYKEEDGTNPLNLYGKYKLEAEKIISHQLEKYVIARTTNVFGWDPETQTPNFLMHLISTLKTQDTIKVPSFLFGTPTYVGDLVEGIMDLIFQEHFGLYHIVGPGYINRYDWAMKCLQMTGIEGKVIEEIKNPPENMVPRPLLSHLDNGKFKEYSHITMKGIEDGLQEFVKAIG